VVNAFDGFKTAIDKKLPVNVSFQKRMLRKVRNRYVSFDKAWQAETLQNGTSYRVSLVKTIQGLTAPRTKQPLCSPLARKMWWIETKPDHTGSVAFMREIFRS
jgi:hypothetical protein